MVEWWLVLSTANHFGHIPVLPIYKISKHLEKQDLHLQTVSIAIHMNQRGLVRCHTKHIVISNKSSTKIILQLYVSVTRH